ncbi:AAA family ATPase [Microbispora sp. RL4-1S]|uniref:AAA family ATPase n=2 Tax=Microbispora oryzae TaxID=2806554 RepID=A0A940WEF7_9ACTN|nr:AAA family ATPase [Microbispora oryzae]
MTAVWDEDPPRSAVANVRTYVNRLRDALGLSGRLTARPPGYLLTVDQGELDVVEFAEALRRGREAVADGRPEEALGHLSPALALWRGAPAEDVPRTRALTPRLDALSEQRCLALETVAEARLMLGEHEEAVAELRDMTAAHPTRERLWGRLMLALYRTGDVAAALTAYGRARELLADELGVEPGPELATLHLAILNRDPALGFTRAARRPPPPPAGVTRVAGGTGGSGGANGTGRVTLTAALTATRTGAGRLVGRDRELQKILSALGEVAGGPRVVALDGPAGVGKSALAREAARIADFPDGVIHVDLREPPGLGPPDPYDAVRRALAAAGPPGDGADPGMERATGRLRAALAGRRVLVLLDNAVDERQVRPVLEASAGCRVLITSRVVPAALDDVAHVAVAPLGDEDAAELLLGLCDRGRGDIRQAKRVVRFCDNLPLALMIAGKRLAVRREWTLGAFADMLADEDQRLDLLTCGDLSVRAAIGADYRVLSRGESAADAHALELFRLMGARGTADCGPGTAARLLGCDPRSASAALGRLADLRLLEPLTLSRLATLCLVGPLTVDHYRMSGLTRLYAREIARG